MKNLLLFPLLATATLCHSAHAEDIAGYDKISVPARHRDAPIAGVIWYPVGTPTYRSMIGEDAVFRGRPAYVGAAIAPGKHPLVLISHGSGGNTNTLAWLASDLALKGALVVAVNHPGSTSGDSSPRRSIRLWERAEDISAALDQVLADPALAPFIDASHITVLGFSMSGATALQVAGMRLNRDAYRDHCAGAGAPGPDCVFFAKGGVDLAALPLEWESDVADPRITTVVAIDPVLGVAFTAQSVADVAQPTLLINLGGPERWQAIDVGPNGSDRAGRMQHASYLEIAPAHHFSFLTECTEAGPMTLEEEGEDPICTDPEGADRAAIHARISAAVAAFLKL